MLLVKCAQKIFAFSTRNRAICHCLVIYSSFSNPMSMISLSYTEEFCNRHKRMKGIICNFVQIFLVFTQLVMGMKLLPTLKVKITHEVKAVNYV